MTGSLTALAAKWAEYNAVGARIMVEAKARKEEAQATLKGSTVAEIRSLLQSRAATKVAIASTLGISRTTLDTLLKSEGGVSVATYFFEKGFMSNAVVVGKLPDSGGFPGLSGDVKVRFISRGSTYVAADEIGRETHSTAELAFMTAQYGDEAYQWALANGVVKSGGAYYDDEGEPDGDGDKGNWI